MMHFVHNMVQHVPPLIRQRDTVSKGNIYTAMKMNELWLRATTQRNLGNLMLRKRK